MNRQNLMHEETQRQIAALVRRAQDGDRQAFGELFTRYEGSVYATALRRLHNEAEAEELVQEVFMKALQKLHQLQAPEAFGAWLRSITTRMAINRAMRRGPVGMIAPEALTAACVEYETPEDSAQRSERKAQLRAGLRRLRKLDRETLVAFYFRGRTLLEMSVEFDSPVGTIKRRLHVARKRLAEELEALAV